MAEGKRKIKMNHKIKSKVCQIVINYVLRKALYLIIYCFSCMQNLIEFSIFQIALKV
jgi:hypothetical protein